MKLTAAILMMNVLLKHGDNFVPSCSYIILNLPHNLTIDVTAGVEQPIYSMIVEDLAGNSAPNITDFRYPSDYFMIQNNDVTVKSCLPVLDNFSGIFDLEILIVGEETICPSAYLTVIVKFAVPDFNLRSGVVVNLTSCSPSDVLEVKQIQLENDDRCNITFNCFVSCTNSDKIKADLFHCFTEVHMFLKIWAKRACDFLKITRDTITTTAADIDFNLTYELNITCYDSRASISSVEAASATLDVNFNNPYSCNSPATSSRTRTNTFATRAKDEEENVNGFLDSLTNIAILSSVGGVSAAAALGAAGTLSYSKKCRPKV